MSSYKLTYFNFTGLGEPVRFMLSYGGVDFEDIRITEEEWPVYKPKMPMKQLPVLEIDGKKYHQSLSICRFLAKKFNVYGSDDYEALEIDAAVDTTDDLRQEMVKFFWNPDPEQAAKVKPESMKKMSEYLAKFESILEDNGGYFVGNKLTWADIFFASLNDYLSAMAGKNVTADHPNLNNLVSKVYNLPGVKSYLDKRPKTKF